MLFAITLGYARPPEEIDAQIDSHRHWLVRHIRAGRIIAAGPLQDGSGGFVLARAAQQADIDAMLAEDPFVQHRLVTVGINGCEPAICAAGFAACWAPAARAV